MLKNLGYVLLVVAVSSIGCATEQAKATPFATYTPVPTSTPSGPPTPTRTPRPPTPTLTPEPPPYVLELLSSNAYIRYGYFHVTGQVKNISSNPQKNVMVAAELYREDDTFVKKAEALIDLNPILPGEVSTFEALTDWGRDKGRYKIRFQYLLGGSILYKDSR